MRPSWLVATVSLMIGGCASESPDPRVDEGRELYGRYCALCHGADGEGYAADQATALTNRTFLATASDELLTRAIARGRPGTTMSAWGKAKGGPLSDADVGRIVAFLRSRQRGPSIDVKGAVVGEPLRGRAVYDLYCKGCHGATGGGGRYTSLANPELLVVAPDGFVKYAIEEGRPGTAMIGFSTLLTEQNVKDVTALIRSWAKAPDLTPVELPGKDLGDPVIHPTGPDAVFEDGLYAAVDAVKAQLDRGARLVILDARAPADYAVEHIEGAVSVPFYAVADYFSQIPKDVFVIAYCGCPHAESGQAAEALRRAGWPKVRVLDEGFFVWKARGYPVRTGAKP